MNPVSSPRWQIAVGACACAATSAYVYAVDPASGAYPQCLLYQTTGLYCAGCGATRAFHALLHGRVIEALHDNVLFVTLLPVMLVMATMFAVRAWSDNRWPALPIAPRTLAWRCVGFAALALLFMTLRNMPGAPFDLLRPLS
jgi:hypothetical protein